MMVEVVSRMSWTSRFTRREDEVVPSWPAESIRTGTASLYGLIAEEVAEIAPDLVARNKDGEIETVYYDKVNAMLFNEVQKLHRRLAELESRVK